MKFGILRRFVEYGWSVLLSDVDIAVLQVRGERGGGRGGLPGWGRLGERDVHAGGAGGAGAGVVGYSQSLGGKGCVVVVVVVRVCV
jgi:hypothetical protein